jgi:hypothetical protein
MKAADFKPPALASEPFPLRYQGGTIDVTVRALMLTERLTVRAQVAKLAADLSLDDSLVFMVPRLLAVSVIDEDGKPLMTAEQWNEYGSAHPTTALELFNKASELSGFSVEAAEKNS